MKAPSYSPLGDPGVVARALVCAAGLGGFVAWAALIPLDQGVTAGGSIMVEQTRQVVQHLEGGIVAEVAVKEGDHVSRGQKLIVLSKATPGAQRDQLLSQLGHLEATLARLQALRSGAAAADYAQVQALGLAPAIAAEIEAKQNDLFRQAVDGHAAEIAMLDARRKSALTTADARATQTDAARRGYEASARQLASARQQLEKRMARLDQVETLERAAAELESEIARLDSERLEALASATDFGAQIERARIDWQEELAKETVEAAADLAAKREAFTAAEDVLARTVITAPSDGEVLNLTATTIGGVVRGGETILEVIPGNTGMVASIRIRPVDRASVNIGQKVRTQLVAYKGWQAPRLDGEITGVSADLKVDQATGAPYYEARITVPADQTARLGEARAAPGMPVQAFIYSGARQTLVEQVAQPVFESWFRGMQQS
jgi:HlyD family type I secretion membrane fusion protein